ncbi:beta strand repeat-containing protein [Pedosphaera parvula]|nr:autotransporter-associated beta strand repeat-containing protein [Pedosphaera parvula]
MDQKVAVIAALCCGVISVQAATVNWIAPLADNYTNRADWSSGALPVAADTASIGNATVLNGSVLYTNTPPDAAATNALTSLVLGNVANGSGAFTMNAGTLSITNTTASGLLLANANASTANFTMNGGVLNVVRNASSFYQDMFQLGLATNSDGAFTLNGGTANFLCGIEIGILGKGTINVTSGTLIDNGWFGVGRGNSATSPGWGNFNLSGGTVYILRNPGNDTQFHGVSFCQQATNGTVNISGGALYCNAIRFAAGPGAGRTDWETFNFSGGDIYLGAAGIVNQNAGGTHNIAINLSGGTFRSVNLGPNTGGTQGLASVGPGGTNWAWASTLPASLNTSPGPGTVTFAPSAGKFITLNNVFSGSGGLALAGPGTVVISGANTYTGPTTVTGGTLAGTGSIQGSVTAGPGSILAPGSSSAPGTLTLGNSLTLNGATNVIKLSADPFTVGNGVNDLLLINGDVALQNISTIKVVPLAPLSSASPYTIAQYSGAALTSAAASHLQVISDSPRYSFSIVDPATTYPYIQISVSGNSANLVWRGGKSPDPTAWDHTTTNWFNSGSSGFDLFFDGDQVAFDDTAANSVVNIVGSEGPAGITMSNNAVAFTFTGTGPLSGPLDMEGTNSVTLAMSNVPIFSSIKANSGTLIYNLQGVSTYINTAAISDNGAAQATLVKGGANTHVLSADNSAFTGTIVVTNGVLQYTNTSGLGLYSSPLYVTNNGSLDLNGVDPGYKYVYIAGNGFNGKGAMTSGSNLAQLSGTIRNLTLVGDAAIGALNRWDIIAGSFNGNNFTLTEVGPGANIFADTGETSLGDIHVVAGRLGFQGNVTMGDPTKSVMLESNATLTLFSVTDANSTNHGPTKTLVMKGGAGVDSGGSSNNYNGEVFLTGTNLIATRSTLHIWGGIHDTNGAGGLILGTNSIGASGGNLWLDGANTYTGPTIISNRTLFVGPSSSLGNSSLIQINSGATLDVTALPTFQLGAGQKLLGNGTVNGTNIVFGSGAQLTAGFVASNTYTLTINGNLTLQPGSTDVVKVRKTTSLANDVITGLTSVTLGGTLVVTNVGPNPLVAGDAIPLFSAAAYSVGTFTTNSIIPSTPGIGLGWDLSTLGTDGTLRVISTATVNPNPTNIVFSISGGKLTLQWPQDHTGWTLQAQTNSLSTGISNNWSAVTGSTTTNQMVMPIDPARPAVFYRLILNQ